MKLDKSFNDNLFSVDGYKVQRRDRNQYDRGLLTVIRSDFPSSRKQSLEVNTFNVIPIYTVFTINSTLISFYWFGTFPTRIYDWDKSNAPTGTSDVNVSKHTFKDLRDVRRSYPKHSWQHT
jgi:hypothetical protein